MGNMDASTMRDYFSLSYERERQATFRAYLFGPFRLVQNGKLLEETAWKRSKAKSLLKWFILHANKPISADYLVNLFWPEASPDTAYQNLHVNIHHLRYLLEPSLSRAKESRFIRRHSINFYIFTLGSSCWIDVIDLNSHLDAAKEQDRLGDYASAAFLYRKVINYLERGFLPEDIYEEYLYPQRRQYERLHIQVLSRLIEIHSHNRQFGEVLDYAYQIFNIDPCNEVAAKEIVTAYYQQGNYPYAMRVIKDFQHLLKAELGMELGDDMCKLRDKLYQNMKSIQRN